MAACRVRVVSHAQCLPRHGLRPTVHARPHTRACASDQRRETPGCSELYDMVNTTQQTLEGAAPPSTTSAASTSQPAAGPSSAAGAAAGPPSSGQAQAERATGYYQGLLTSELKQDNGASANDMLKRNLQLALGVSGLLAALVLGFMASNGLL